MSNLAASTDRPSAPPRGEYPRPRLQRPDWASLNGAWEFAFADGDQGLGEGWSDGRPLPQRITVPFAPQTQASGVHDTSIHEVVWYARSFELPPQWRADEADTPEEDPRDVLLRFGAVDYRATVWVNGREVGHNCGGHVPFFDITPYLNEGENRLCLRVEDRQDPCPPRGKQASSGKTGGIDYFCTTGIWQSVWLEPVAPVCIDDIRVTPQRVTPQRVTPQLGRGSQDDALEVAVFLHAPSTGWDVRVEVLDAGEVVASAHEESAEAVARLTLSIPNAKHWSPDSPHLYELRVQLLENGQLVDEVRSYAGVREVRLRDGRLELNGEPTYLKMVLDQGYWPESGMTAPTDEALRADAELIKAFGFNGARKHQKIEDPRWLYWCDRLGLLVWSEMPNARAWSSESQELLEMYRDLMQGLAELPFVSGFCYTQLTDIEQEINGLLTYDRRTKVEPERIVEIHNSHWPPNKPSQLVKPLA
jgi:beta-galactosidase/beta-glucuronidase